MTSYDCSIYDYTHVSLILHICLMVDTSAIYIYMYFDKWYIFTVYAGDQIMHADRKFDLPGSLTSGRNHDLQYLQYQSASPPSTLHPSTNTGLLICYFWVP